MCRELGVVLSTERTAVYPFADAPRKFFFIVHLSALRLTALFLLAPQRRYMFARKGYASREMSMH
jgi:hypothetical protein